MAWRCMCAGAGAGKCGGAYMLKLYRITCLKVCSSPSNLKVKLRSASSDQKACFKIIDYGEAVETRASTWHRDATLGSAIDFWYNALYCSKLLTCALGLLGGSVLLGKFMR